MSLVSELKRINTLFSQACEAAELEQAGLLLCDIDSLIAEAATDELEEAREQILTFSSTLEHYTCFLSNAKAEYEENTSKISSNVRKIGKYVDNC